MANATDHRGLQQDGFADFAAQIAAAVSAISVAGGQTMTADVVATVPLTLQGFSAAQTGDLLDIKQNSGGTVLLAVKTVASAVNGAQFTAAATGNSPTIAATGSDGTVALTLQAKANTNSVVINDSVAAATTPLLVLNATDTTTGAVTDGFTGAIRLAPVVAGANTVTRLNYMDVLQPTGAATITDACVMRFNAAAGTHKAVDAGTAKTSPGTVTQWIKVNVNGTIGYIPSYASKTS